MSWWGMLVGRVGHVARGEAWGIGRVGRVYSWQGGSVMRRGRDIWVDRVERGYEQPEGGMERDEGKGGEGRGGECSRKGKGHEEQLGDRGAARKARQGNTLHPLSGIHVTDPLRLRSCS